MGSSRDGHLGWFWDTSEKKLSNCFIRRARSHEDRWTEEMEIPYFILEFVILLRIDLNLFLPLELRSPRENPSESSVISSPPQRDQSRGNIWMNHSTHGWGTTPARKPLGSETSGGVSLNMILHGATPRTPPLPVWAQDLWWPCEEPSLRTK